MDAELAWIIAVLLIVMVGFAEAVRTRLSVNREAELLSRQEDRKFVNVMTELLMDCPEVHFHFRPVIELDADRSVRTMMQREMSALVVKDLTGRHRELQDLDGTELLTLKVLCRTRCPSWFVPPSDLDDETDEGLLPETA